MQNNELFDLINRRQLLSYLGVSVAVAVPVTTLAYVSPSSNLRQSGAHPQVASVAKKIVVSF